MCKSKKLSQIEEEGSTSNESQDNLGICVLGKRKTKVPRAQISVYLNGHLVKMEFDSGTRASNDRSITLGKWMSYY